MGQRIALVGAVERKGMEKHIDLLGRDGPHWDGWTQTNVLDVAASLFGQLRGRGGGHFRVYLYDSGQPPARKVQWVARVEPLRLSWPPEWFVDPAHGDEYDASAQFRYTMISPVPGGMGLDAFRRLNGTRLTSRDGRELVNRFIVVEDG